MWHEQHIREEAAMEPLQCSLKKRAVPDLNTKKIYTCKKASTIKREVTLTAKRRWWTTSWKRTLLMMWSVKPTLIWWCLPIHERLQSCLPNCSRQKFSNEIYCTSSTYSKATLLPQSRILSSRAGVRSGCRTTMQLYKTSYEARHP